MAHLIENLSECKVEIVAHARPRTHRHAETRATGPTTVDSDDEHVAPPRSIVGIDERSASQDAIVNRDCVQLARARADEGQSFVWIGFWHDLDATGRSGGPPEVPSRLVKELFPRVRSWDISEQGRVRTSCEPEGSGFLHIGPADWEVGHTGQLVVNDGAVPNGRAHKAISSLRSASNR